MTSTHETLLLRDVTLEGGRRVDVRLRGTAIESVQNAGTPAQGGELLDLSGYLLLPAPVEVHAHLDKAFSADLVPNPGGDLAGAVSGWLGHRSSFSSADISERVLRALKAYLAHGATAIRTHVDVGKDIGLRAFEAVSKASAGAAVQVVAFASTPLSGADGAVNRSLLRDALAAGADVVGACPGLDPDPKECIELCLDLAEEYAAPVDLHVDEWLEPEPCTLALLAEAVLATEFPYGVVASHCVSLGMMDPARIRGIADQVARAGIAVVCLPHTNLYLQGRQRGAAAPRGLTAVRALRQAGVTVAAGGDNLQDPFNCLGRADPLETAALLVLAGHDNPEDAYAAISNDARRAIGYPEVSISPGAPAELLAIRATSVREAIATAHPDRVVIRSGRVVARSIIHRQWPSDSESAG